MKPLFGSQGNGIRRAATPEELPPAEAVGNVYYAQSYLRAARDTTFTDWRYFVSNGRVLSAMARVGRTWITNVHQGAEPMSVTHLADEEERGFALAATEAVGADYAGVDLIRDRDGRLLVLEINSNPAWKGLQSVTDIDEDFLASLGAPARV